MYISKSTKEVSTFKYIFLECSNNANKAFHVAMTMSNQEPTRWQHNRIYPHPIKYLCVHLRFTFILL